MSRITKVRASAGSGKTYKLTELFLELLANSSRSQDTKTYTWKHILAMTFTNNAVSEMKHAVVRALKTIALGNTTLAVNITPDEASLWIETILQNYDALQIKTIDSLLLTILRLSALALELPPSIQPLLEGEEKDILAELYTQFTADAEHNEEYRILLEQAWHAVLSEDTSGGIMLQSKMQTEIINLTLLLHKHNFFPLTANTSKTLRIYSEYIGTLQERYGKKNLTKAITQKAEKIHTLLQEHSVTEKYLYKKFIDALKSPFTAKGMPSKYLMQEEFSDVCKKNIPIPSEVLRNQLCEQYIHLRHSCIVHSYASYAVRSAITIAPLVRIAQHLRVLFEQYQKAHGVFALSTAPRVVREIYNSPEESTEAFMRLDSSLQHVLIDEFQDTSTAQWEALSPLIANALATGGSFTYVGDVKQAIYGWRGGESQLFEGVQQYFSLMPQEETLEYNWRSASPIVHFANIFSAMEQPEYATLLLTSMVGKKIEKIQKEHPMLLENAITTVQNAYTKGAQAISSNTKGITGLVRITELHKIERDLEEEKQEEEASRVYEEVQELLHSLIAKYPLRDITFLTRTNKESTLLSTWLLEWEIPYIIEGGIFLHTSRILQHCIAFLSFITTHNPVDFWTLLTSELLAPYIEKSALYAWRIANNKAPLVEHFMESFPTQWQQCFSPFYKITLSRPYEYIQELCSYFSLYERFPKQKIYIQSFLEIVYSLEEKGVRSCSELLTYWQQHATKHTLPSNTAIDAVQIISIHKSKGLEFPVVIIPFTAGMKNNTTKKDLQCILIGDILPPEEHPYATDLLDIPIITKVPSDNPIAVEKAIATAIEEINLMYVAYTRAKRELHIIIDTTAQSEDRSSANVIRTILSQEEILPTAHALQKTIAPTKTLYEYTTLAPSTELRPVECITITKQHLEPAVEIPMENKGYIPMAWLPTLQQQELTSTALLTGISPVQRGELLHLAMEHFLTLGTITQAVSMALRTIPKEYYQECFQDIYDRITWFASTTLYESIRTARILCEPSIVCRSTSGNIIIRPDAIVQEENKWYILEYKTGEQYQEHIEQITRYKDTVQQSTTVPVQGIVLYLDKEHIVFV